LDSQFFKVLKIYLRSKTIIQDYANKYPVYKMALGIMA